MHAPCQRDFLTSYSSATRHEWLNLFSSRHECFTSDSGLTRTRLVSCVFLTSLNLDWNDQTFYQYQVSLGTYPNQAFGGLQKPGGGTFPLAKTLLPFSESIQVKFFWKLVPKWVSWNNFGFHGKHGWCFKVVHSFPIFDWESLYKYQKPCFPCWKPTNITFSESLLKTKSNDIVLVPWRQYCPI